MMFGVWCSLLYLCFPIIWFATHFLIVESTLTGELWTDDLSFWGLVVVLIDNFSFSVVGECVQSGLDRFVDNLLVVSLDKGLASFSETPDSFLVGECVEWSDFEESFLDCDRFTGGIWVSRFVEECVGWLDEDKSFIDDVWGSMFIIVLVFSNNVICDSFLIVESTLTGELWTDDVVVCSILSERRYLVCDICLFLSVILRDCCFSLFG